jgi:hypothetical protein
MVGVGRLRLVAGDGAAVFLVFDVVRGAAAVLCTCELRVNTVTSTSAG